MIHWWLANVGLAALVAGFVLAPHVGRKSVPLTATGGLLFALGALAFGYNLWRTFNAADARQRARVAVQSGPQLPTAGE